MTSEHPAVEKLEKAGAHPMEVAAFRRRLAQLSDPDAGKVPGDELSPVAPLPRLDDLPEPDAETTRSVLDRLAVVKLNGGLGTSMGLDGPKSTLEIKPGQSFLDVIARQTLALRASTGARLPLLLMDSPTTRPPSLERLAAHEGLADQGLPLDFLQGIEPKLDAESWEPVEWPANPELEWCPPGHGDIYTAMRGTGLIDLLVERGFQYVFVSNSDNLGAVPDPRVAGWFAGSGAPFAIEAVRRTPSDRKGGHFARRKSDGRLVLRETAQTPKADLEALADLERHRFCSTNNLWFDLAAMKGALDQRQGILGLPLIRNTKTVDPGDSSTPEVIQVETAMGAAIEVFEGSQLIEVDRSRFVPVKTTNDLLVLRSDVYDLGRDFVLDQSAAEIPFVDLDSAHYKLVKDFDQHFPEGAPSLAKATSLRVSGDVTFGRGVQVVGDVALDARDADRVPEGTVLQPDGLDGTAD